MNKTPVKNAALNQQKEKKIPLYCRYANLGVNKCLILMRHSGLFSQQHEVGVNIFSPMRIDLTEAGTACIN